MIDTSKILRELVSLCTRVGAYIANEATQFDFSSVEEKGLNDLVSYVDKTAEQQLVEGLQRILPEAGFIAEEGTAGNSKEPLLWIVDPLDGTTNFTHGLPIFAISVALSDEKGVLLGVVYEVNRRELFSAIRGGGTRLNGERVFVSHRAHLGQSLLATGFPYWNFDKIANYLKILDDFMQATHGLRRMGSAAVDLAYVACGRFEGFFEYNLNAWDVAAGSLLVQEAGGQVTDFSGGNDFLFGKEIIAAGLPYNEIQTVVSKHWNE